jgi:hypothetical protein
VYECHAHLIRRRPSTAHPISAVDAGIRNHPANREIQCAMRRRGERVHVCSRNQPASQRQPYTPPHYLPTSQPHTHTTTVPANQPASHTHHHTTCQSASQSHTPPHYLPSQHPSFPSLAAYCQTSHSLPCAQQDIAQASADAGTSSGYGSGYSSSKYSSSGSAIVSTEQ